jgi:hypothetical protein
VPKDQNPHTIIAGVQSGGAPWTVQHGSAGLNVDGQLHVELKNLILPQLGNAGSVTSVSASLVCGGSGGTVVATTDAVPLSSDGNAEIEARIDISSACFAPIVLVRAAAFSGNPLPQPGPWIDALQLCLEVWGRQSPVESLAETSGELQYPAVTHQPDNVQYTVIDSCAAAARGKVRFHLQPQL